MVDIACIGTLVADVITKTVDRFPQRGKLNLIDSMRLYSGGCAMSAAIDLKKLGADVAVLGMVGADGFGQFLTEELQRQGVDTRGIAVHDTADTSSSVVLVDSGGERSFLHCLGADGVFTEADIRYDVIADARIVFVGGALIMPAFDGDGCAQTLKKAREMGKVTVLDTAWDDAGRWMQALAPALKYVDYFIPSIEEAEMLSGEKELDRIAACFFDRGVKTVVIKLGSRGCSLWEGKDSPAQFFPAYTNIRAVDTTGAGDSFCAGFLYGLSQGFSLPDACRTANAVGAHCVMSTGATTGIQPYPVIEKFMKEQEEH